MASRRPYASRIQPSRRPGAAAKVARWIRWPVCLFQAARNTMACSPNYACEFREHSRSRLAPGHENSRHASNSRYAGRQVQALLDRLSFWLEAMVFCVVRNGRNWPPHIVVVLPHVLSRQGFGTCRKQDPHRRQIRQPQVVDKAAYPARKSLRNRKDVDFRGRAPPIEFAARSPSFDPGLRTLSRYSNYRSLPSAECQKSEIPSRSYESALTGPIGFHPAIARPLKSGSHRRIGAVAPCPAIQWLDYTRRSIQPRL